MFKYVCLFPDDIKSLPAAARDFLFSGDISILTGPMLYRMLGINGAEADGTKSASLAPKYFCLTPDDLNAPAARELLISGDFSIMSEAMLRRVLSAGVSEASVPPAPTISGSGEVAVPRPDPLTSGSQRPPLPEAASAKPSSVSTAPTTIRALGDAATLHDEGPAKPIDGPASIDPGTAEASGSVTGAGSLGAASQDQSLASVLSGSSNPGTESASEAALAPPPLAPDESEPPKGVVDLPQTGSHAAPAPQPADTAPPDGGGEASSQQPADLPDPGAVFSVQAATDATANPAVPAATAPAGFDALAPEGSSLTVEPARRRPGRPAGSKAKNKQVEPKPVEPPAVEPVTGSGAQPPASLEDAKPADRPPPRQKEPRAKTSAAQQATISPAFNVDHGVAAISGMADETRDCLAVVLENPDGLSRRELSLRVGKQIAWPGVQAELRQRLRAAVGVNDLTVIEWTAEGPTQDQRLSMSAPMRVFLARALGQVIGREINVCLPENSQAALSSGKKGDRKELPVRPPVTAIKKNFSGIARSGPLATGSPQPGPRPSLLETRHTSVYAPAPKVQAEPPPPKSAPTPAPTPATPGGPDMSDLRGGSSWDMYKDRIGEADKQDVHTHYRGLAGPDFPS